MKYIRIPQDRIGVLIGPQGKTKEQIEQQARIAIDVDSKLGEVRFNEQALENPLLTFQIENVIRAIGRGFTPEHALLLFNDEYDLIIFNIHDYVGKKPSHVKRLKSRIIGTQGKTRTILEEVTNSYISIYGHTVAIIGSIIEIDITKKAIDKLLSGAKHATVYKFIEKQMKKLQFHRPSEF